jgi:hypothetical protein
VLYVKPLRLPSCPKFDSTIPPSSMIWRRGARERPPDCLQVGTDTWRARILVDVASANIFQTLISVSATSLGRSGKLSYSLQPSPSTQNCRFPFRGAKWCLGMYDKEECLTFVRVPSPTFQIPVDSLTLSSGVFTVM